MDDLDIQLIGLLRQDARMSATALAEVLGVSRATVQNRMDRLLAEGRVLGFTVRLPPEIAEADGGRVWGIASIETSGPSAPVIEALRALPELDAVHTTSGRWNLVAELSAASLTEFSQALEALRGVRGVGAVEASLLLETHRF